MHKVIEIQDIFNTYHTLHIERDIVSWMSVNGCISDLKTNCIVKPMIKQRARSMNGRTMARTPMKNENGKEIRL